VRETENSHRTHLGRSDDAGVLLETCAYCETQIAAGASATLIGLLVRFWPSALVKSGIPTPMLSHQEVVKEDEDRQRMAGEKHHPPHEAAISA
jgi:hypothetical protein